MEIPADIRVRCYNTIRRIRSDFARPVPMARSCVCYWGPSRVGKSYRAATEAGPDYFPKNPRSKFWDGYQGEEHVVINEFRGDIAVGYLLEWLDCYKVNVEIKGSSLPLLAKRFWITSNLPPAQWYKEIDGDTLEALFNRMEIIHINERLY